MGPTQQLSQCFWCGGNHQQPRKQHCPAFGKRFGKCGINGHFAPICRGGARRQGRQQQSNFLDDDNDEEAFVANCETPPQPVKKFFAHLQLIHGRKTKVVKAQIDSTSTCNTIPSSLLKEVFPDVKISRTKSKINTYGSETTERRRRSKAQYDKRVSAPLAELSEGDKEYVEPRPTKKHQPWIYGEVIGRPAPRSCLVSTAMRPVRRNHAQIREAKAEPVDNYDGKLYRFETASLPSESGPIEETDQDSTTFLWTKHSCERLTEF